MAESEGFKLAIILVVSFMLMSGSSLYLVSLGKSDVATLKELFTSLGTLAAMFGIPGIVSAWIVTRGQTSTQIPSLEPPEP
ncbi:hypothetical protein M0R72_17100 [Candidatus Pacearchaeota archaeon]|jgi:hypothetical protein|nr:hypothetical protein [Candidatus Pacearchaeota archaeon]